MTKTTAHTQHCIDYTIVQINENAVLDGVLAEDGWAAEEDSVWGWNVRDLAISWLQDGTTDCICNH